MCKVTDGRVWEVTEECFREGHLKFHGSTTWLYDRPAKGDDFDTEGWEAVDSVTTTEGTTPEGSEWASLVMLGQYQDGDMWAVKNLVEVPESLEPGEYVLSFRWDCQKTPQVWSSCANIQVV